MGADSRVGAECALRGLVEEQRARVALDWSVEGCLQGHLRWAATAQERKGVVGMGSRRRLAGVTQPEPGIQSDRGREGRKRLERVVETNPSHRVCLGGELSEEPLSLVSGERQDVGR